MIRFKCNEPSWLVLVGWFAYLDVVVVASVLIGSTHYMDFEI